MKNEDVTDKQAITWIKNNCIYAEQGLIYMEFPHTPIPCINCHYANHNPVECRLWTMYLEGKIYD